MYMCSSCNQDVFPKEQRLLNEHFPNRLYYNTEGTFPTLFILWYHRFVGTPSKSVRIKPVLIKIKLPNGMITPFITTIASHFHSVLNQHPHSNHFQGTLYTIVLLSMFMLLHPFPSDELLENQLHGT